MVFIFSNFELKLKLFSRKGMGGIALYCYIHGASLMTTSSYVWTSQVFLLRGPTIQYLRLRCLLQKDRSTLVDWK